MSSRTVEAGVQIEIRRYTTFRDRHHLNNNYSELLRSCVTTAGQVTKRNIPSRLLSIQPPFNSFFPSAPKKGASKGPVQENGSCEIFTLLCSLHIQHAQRQTRHTEACRVVSKPHSSHVAHFIAPTDSTPNTPSVRSVALHNFILTKYTLLNTSRN